MDCLSFVLCSGAKPRMGALEGKAQEMTQRAETLEGGALRLPLSKRSSVQPPTGAVASGGLIRLRARFARPGAALAYCGADSDVQSVGFFSFIEKALQLL